MAAFFQGESPLVELLVAHGAVEDTYSARQTADIKALQSFVRPSVNTVVPARTVTELSVRLDEAGATERAALWVQTTAQRTSVLSRMLGAKPPSSPTLHASCPYLSLMTFFRLW